MSRNGCALGIGSLLLGVVVACSAFNAETTNDPVDAGGLEEASSLDDARAEATLPPSDGGVDGAVACTMANPANAPLTDPRWMVRGSATILPDGGAQLTSKTAEQAGALWWSQKHAVRRFVAQFQIRIVAPQSGVRGDGLALVWAESGAVPNVGGIGGNLGACGLSGFAIGFDSLLPDGGNGGELKAMVTTAGTCPDSPSSVSSLPASLFDGALHSVEVVVDGKIATVTIDATAYPLTLPAEAKFDGYVGFTAGTGGATSEHEIVAPTIQFTESPLCP